MFRWFCSKLIPETMYQISAESPEFYRRYYKNIWSLFSGRSVQCENQVLNGSLEAEE